MTSYKQLSFINMDNYINRLLFLLLEVINKLYNPIIKVTTSMLNPIEKIFYLLLSAIAVFFDSFFIVFEIVFKRLYYILRIITVPYNWILPNAWLKIMMGNKEATPLDTVGVHYVFGPPGTGKSILLKLLADETNKTKKKGVFLTHKLEKIKEDSEGNKYLNNMRIDLKTYFDLRTKIEKNGELIDNPNKGTQTKEFNFELFPELYIDEFHKLNNHRENRTSDYNLFFKPLLEQFIDMRHDGCNRVVLCSQVPSNDIQLMGMLAGYHAVKVKKGIKWSEWLKTGKFNYRPLKVRIKSYGIDPFKPDKKKLLKTWYKPITPENLEDYETYAMRGQKNHLRKDYTKKGGFIHA